MTYRQMYIAFRTILEKEVRRVFRLWIQTILPAVVTTTLYFLIFGTFIGSQVKSVGGVSYMAFIIPGLVLMTIVNSAFQGMLFSFYFMKFQKTVEEILVSPMPHALVVASYVVSALVRGAIVGGLVFFVGFLFEPVTVMHPLIALLVGALTSVLFSLIGLVNAVYAKNFDDLNIISTFLLTPLTYLGGIFYSVKLLPDIWQTVSYLNPMLYLINGFRYSILGFSDIAIMHSLLVIIACSLLMFAWVLYLFRIGKGLRA